MSSRRAAAAAAALRLALPVGAAACLAVLAASAFLSYGSYDGTAGGGSRVEEEEEAVDVGGAVVPLQGEEAEEEEEVEEDLGCLCEPEREEMLLSPLYDEEEESCTPVTKVAFAKTHKTGSSTVQNLLLRFGVNHDLTFAMPPNSWMFSVVDPLKVEVVLQGPWKDLGGFDIFAFHCRWDYDEVRKIVPDAKFVTILREPLDTFESNYVYMGAQKSRRADLNEFAERFAARGEGRGKKAYVGQNNLLWDLGMEARDLDNMTAVGEKIRLVEEQFDLVMIMERFDESLVLLADLFCWPLEEVRYIKQNERLAELRNVPTDRTRDIMRTWLRGDYKVGSPIMSNPPPPHPGDLGRFLIDRQSQSLPAVRALPVRVRPAGDRLRGGQDVRGRVAPAPDGGGPRRRVRGPVEGGRRRRRRRRRRAQDRAARRLPAGDGPGPTVVRALRPEGGAALRDDTQAPDRQGQGAQAQGRDPVNCVLYK